MLLRPIIFWFVMALGALTMAVTCATVKPVAAHSKAITECAENIIYTEAVLLDEYLDEGKVVYWAEAYDTNGDGVKDVLALSHITALVMDPTSSHVMGYEHDPNPVYWLVDLDSDDVPDKAYIDINGKGDCNDIKLYKNLRNPTRNFDSLGGASI